MADEKHYEIEFHDGEITVWAIIPVPDIGQETRDPVRKELISYSYAELPVSELRIDGVREFAGGHTGSNSILMRVDDVQLQSNDTADESE